MSLMGLEHLKKGGSDEAHTGTGGFTPESLPRIGEPKLDAARARIMAAMKANHIFRCSRQIAHIDGGRHARHSIAAPAPRTAPAPSDLSTAPPRLRPVAR